MKKRSIIAKITIWYTIFLAGIALALVLGLMQAQSARQKDVAEREIAEILAGVTERMAMDGEDYIYDREIEYYQKATYVSIYDRDGELIIGRRPASVAEFPDFSEDQLLLIRDTGGSEWYVYDRVFRDDTESLWVRGMMKHTASRDAGTFSLRFLLIALPAVIVLAALGGRAITRRAFRPLREIIHTTNEIRADADVSRRIPTGENRDELHELTVSINGMFDRIEDVLSREKQFTSDVSHELRTPVAVIQSQSEYALEDPEYRQKALETIHHTARGMNSLLNRLLLLSRSDAGTLTPALEVVDFSELLETVAEQQEFAAADARMELITDIPAGICVIADEEFVLRIILNLLSNAFRYGKTPVQIIRPQVAETCNCGANQSGTDEPSLEKLMGGADESIAETTPAYAGTVRLTLRTEGDFAACTVSDCGPGIAPEEQEKIWERFYQIDHSRTDSGRGDTSAGLGLSMVRALTKAMGGSASVESSPGCGAAFTVKLPLA